jgi:hypothetical protein
VIALLAHGLCSPLGPAEIAAAALRADLSRASQFPDAPLLGFGEDAAPAVCHAVLPPGIADRSAVLLQLAWQELLRCSTTPAAERLLLCQALPDPLRWGPDGPPDHSSIATRISGITACERLELGHAGPAAALLRAEALIAARTCRRVLIAAVDSLLDPASLAWLAADERLRGPETPDGLAPGEAAAWWLVGQADPQALAHLEAGYVSTDGHRAPRDDGERLLAASGQGEAAEDWIDATGDMWRARALGWLRRDAAVTPADGWGDLGACSALAAGSLVLHGQRPARVWSLAEDGSAGCVRIS